MPTTKKQIVNYWASRVDESDLGVDWCDALDRCWRCAIETKRLERCHIIPKSLGGSDDKSNFYGINAIALLKDAEDFPDILEKIKDSMDVLFTQVTYHWGEDINDTTRAWIVNEILKEMKLI